MLEPPRFVTCFEFRTRLKGGESKPPLVVAKDAEGNEYSVVVKVRRPPGGNHQYETSLACELICSALARRLGFSVPDYFVVTVPFGFLISVADADTRNLFRENLGPNFGTGYVQGMTEWNAATITTSDGLLDALEDVLGFDSTILNCDRRADKPNLLYRGERLLLIDHSLAFPVDDFTFAQIEKNPLFTDQQIRSHCSFQNLAGKGRRFGRVYDNWDRYISEVEIEQIRGMVPPEWEQSPGHLDRIFGILKGRIDWLQRMQEQIWRIVK